MKLNPVFNDLHNPDTILNHVQELKATNDATAHAEILEQLIEQFEPLDFEALAFPQKDKILEEIEELERMHIPVILTPYSGTN